MALRLRRGLDIERSAITFAEGEPLYTTDTKQLYIGDGITPGGVQIGGMNNLIDDTAPQLGNDLDLNTYNITGVGSINVDGNLTITGKVVAEFIEADYRGSIFGNDSAVLVDSNNNSLHADLYRSDGVKAVDFETGLVALDTTPAKALSDINYGIPEIGDVLSWNGSEWTGQTFGGNSTHSSILQYVVDVGFVGTRLLKAANDDTIINIDTGYVNITNQKLEELLDVFVDDLSIEENDVLTWDGTNWTHKQITIDLGESELPINALLDVYSDNPSINDILVWDGINYVNQPFPESTNTLEELEDVFFTNLQQDDILSFDGNSWVNVPNTFSVKLEDLTDVFITQPPAAGDILTYDGINWVAADGIENVVSTYDTPQENDILKFKSNLWVSEPIDPITLEDIIDPADVQLDDVLQWNGIEWLPVSPLSLIDSLQGNVYALDSTLLIDASVSQVVGDVNNSLVNTNAVTTTNLTTNTLTSTNIDTTGISCKFFTQESTGTHAMLSVQTIDNTDPFNASTLELLGYKTTGTFASDEIVGKIYFSVDDDSTSVNERIAKTIMVSQRTRFVICNDDNNSFGEEISLCLTNGKFGVGTYDPTTKLDVVGDVKVSGFTQFGSLSTTERDALTAADGMVIYNNTTSKFQGYAGGAWVDLH